MLAEWLPSSGLVLEIASGTGEHAVHFAKAFPGLAWQPSDADQGAVASIGAWREAAQLPNLHPPLLLDASAAEWPIDRADALLSINMVHISPWTAALGLIAGAGRVLPEGGPLILYGPWIRDDVPTAPSNLAFDADLRRRDACWGLRRVKEFAGAAQATGYDLAEVRSMPANNSMLLFVRGGAGR